METTMWLFVVTIAFLVLVTLVLKVMERRASKDAFGPEDMPDMRRLGRNDPYGGDAGAGDGGGGGGW